jgi:hypothetical protein
MPCSVIRIVTSYAGFVLAFDAAGAAASAVVTAAVAGVSRSRVTRATRASGLDRCTTET